MDNTIEFVKVMISIVIPAFNVENYIEDCIKSVIRQTYKDWEILLIDDGSTDRTSIICESFALEYNNIKVYHTYNKGVSAAKNLGLTRALGDWIIFLDADDYWISDECLSTVVKVISLHDVDILRYEYKAVDEKGIDLYAHSIEHKYSISNRVISSYPFFHTALNGEFFGWLCAFRKDIILQHKFDESISYQEDVDFFIRLFAIRDYRCIYIPERFYAYRKRTQSLTTTPNVNNLKSSFILCDRYSRLAETMECLDLQKEYRYYSVFKYYRTISTITEDTYYSSYHQILRQINVTALYFRTLYRMIKHNIWGKFSLFILMPPIFSVPLIRLKNQIVAK